MKLTGKNYSKILACLIVAGMTATGTTGYFPAGLRTTEIYAVDASAADEFLSTAEDIVRCSVVNDGEKNFKLNGRTYYQGIIFGDGSYNSDASVSFNVEGISSLSFSFGHVDNSESSPAEISIYLDDILEDKLVVRQNDLVDEYSLNVENASVVRIESKHPSKAKYAIADLSVDSAAPSKTYVTPEYNTAAAFIGSAYDSVRTSFYQGTGTESSFKMNGRSYYQGIVFADDSYSEGSSATFNVENVKKLSFSLGHVDNTDSSSAEFSIYLDNILEDKFILSQNSDILQYELDVADAKTVRICRTGYRSKYALADLTVDELKPKTTYTTPVYKSSTLLLGSLYDNYRTVVYDGQSSAISFKMNGRNYYQGIVMGDGSYSDNAAFSLNVENLKSVSFEMGHVDDSDSASAEFSVYLDGELEDKFTLSQNLPVQKYELDVTNAKTLRIFRDGYHSQYGIANIVADELVPKNSFSVPEYKNAASFINSGYDSYRTEPYDGLSKAVFFNMNGRSYYQGVIMGDGSYSDNAAVSFNVENIKNISFDLGHVDNSESYEADFTVYLDGAKYDEFTLRRGGLIRNYSIDVSQAATLRIFRNGYRARYALGDIKIDELESKNVHSVPVFSSAEEFIGSMYDNYRAEAYENQIKVKSFKMNEKEYATGITLGNDSYNEGAAAWFNVENIDSVSFILGHADGSGNDDSVLSVYKDGKEYETIKLSASMVPHLYTVDVSDASTLSFYKSGYKSIYGLGDLAIVPSDNSSAPVTTPAVTTTAKPAVSTTPAVTTTAKPAVSTTPAVTTTAKPAVSTTPAVTTTAKPDPSAPVKGDLNADGEVTTSDVRVILKHIVGSQLLSDESSADFDGDGKVTTSDALKLLKFVIGETDSL